MKLWKNGAKAKSVREVILENFALLFKYFKHNILALTTEARTKLISDYIKNGVAVPNDIRVYDTDLEQWYKYTSSGWKKWSMVEDIRGIAKYEKTFDVSSWIEEQMDAEQKMTMYTQQISYDIHGYKNPDVSLYMYVSSRGNNALEGYISVLGGVTITEDNTVVISSDRPFQGKVVIM